ncbi:GNAT family N-acetyltransferase [Sphingobacterium sp. KU25419]|nr:GNAT family N-acetyltransferase [Sphingobacterium sp. KU25419]
MKNISIYHVEPEDVAEVLPYVLDFRRKLFPMLDPNQIPKDLKAFEDLYLQSTAGAFLQARTADGVLIGVIGMLHYDYRFPHLDIDAKNTVEVARLFVDPKYRRTGLGTELFQSLLTVAKEKQIERLYLHTHPFLDGAYEFWLRQGFQLMEYRDESGFLTIHMELMVDEMEMVAVVDEIVVRTASIPL